jgi:hypothetical protein
MSNFNEVKGDANVARTGYFGRRANQGLTFVPPLAAPHFLHANSHWWNRLQTDGSGPQIVHLPDPSTIPNGWEVVIQNDSMDDNLIIQKFNATYVETIPPRRAITTILIDAAVPGGEWYLDGVIELHEEVSFNDTDWLSNQILIIAQGTPGAGEVGPHRLPIGGTYSVTVWQDLPASNARIVGVSTYVDRNTGVVRMVKAGKTQPFSGKIFLCARL